MKVVLTFSRFHAPLAISSVDGGYPIHFRGRKEKAASLPDTVTDKRCDPYTTKKGNTSPLAISLRRQRTHASSPIPMATFADVKFVS